MKSNLILVGGGGHCKACIDVIESGNSFEIIGVVDATAQIGSSVCGYPILGNDSAIEGLAATHQNFLITVGHMEPSRVREKLFTSVKSAGGTLPIIIAPSARVSRHARIAEGTIIMHNAIVNAHANIGAGCIINTGAIVEHDSTIGSFCHISTGATVNGGCLVQEGTFVGSNACLREGVKIGARVLVGAGCVVIRDVSPEVTLVGNPGRVRLEKLR